MATFNCGYCDKENITTESKYKVRLTQSKTGILYCNPQCSSKGRKILRLSKGLPITITSEDILNTEFDAIFRAVLANPKNIIGGDTKLSHKGETCMTQQSMTLGQLVIMDGSIMGCPAFYDDEGNIRIILGVPAPTAVPQAPPQVFLPSGEQLQMPTAAPVIPQSPPPAARPAMPGQATAQPMAPARWQYKIENYPASLQSIGQAGLSSVAIMDCDAKYWTDGAGQNLGKSCQYNPERQKFEYCPLDQATNQPVFTMNGNQCLRCSSKGWMQLQNIGFNWEFDLSRNMTVHQDFEAYFTEKLQGASKTHPKFTGVAHPAPEVSNPVVIPSLDDNPF